MNSLIDNLQFGGEHALKNENDAHSTVATNQNGGRLTFPLNLMQSGRKDNNTNYFDLDKNKGLTKDANCKEIEQFFD